MGRGRVEVRVGCFCSLKIGKGRCEQVRVAVGWAWCGWVEDPFEFLRFRMLLENLELGNKESSLWRTVPKRKRMKFMLEVLCHQ